MRIEPEVEVRLAFDLQRAPEPAREVDTDDMPSIERALRERAACVSGVEIRARSKHHPRARALYLNGDVVVGARGEDPDHPAVVDGRHLGEVTDERPRPVEHVAPVRPSLAVGRCAARPRGGRGAR